jgi:protein-S-isoprenylcysteine O-methyltransferase Ste14
MAFIAWKKLKREAIPLIFFGTAVSIKAYFLGKILFIEGGWTQLLNLMSYAQAGVGEVHYVLLDMWTYIFYNIVAILFDSLVFASYLIRLEPTHKAQGFRETLYPLATVLLPVSGFTLLTIPSIRVLLPTFDAQALIREYNLSPAFPILMNVAGLLIGAIGATLSIMALWSLRKSFSLMTEVRELVTTGLYRRIRHPLYMAEITHILGLAILSATPIGIGLFVIATAMQVVRAKIEENKFLQTVPEYTEFKHSTGFLWPKLW